MRFAYLNWSIPPDSPTTQHVDIWGDGIHFWLLSYLTATHGFVYQDLKPIGLQVIWLPLHPLIAALVMRLTGDYSLNVLHSLNVFYGTLSCILVYFICKALYRRNISWAFAGGIGLAFNAWWIAFNGDGIVETLLTLSILFVIYFWVKGDMVKLPFFVFLAGFVKYEAWFFTGIIFIILVIRNRFTLKTFTLYSLALVLPVVIWSWWSWTQTRNWLAWYRLQVNSLTWDAGFLPKPSSLFVWSYYPILISAMTAGLIILGVAVSLRHGGQTRRLCLVGLSYLLFRAWGFAQGATLSNERYVAELIPFAYILAIPLLPQSLVRNRNRIIYCIALLLLITVPLVSQIWVFPKMAYVNNPQIRAGLWLRNEYTEGLVACDLPTVIGYSYPNPKPENFLSTSTIYDQYLEHGASLKWLYGYLRARNIIYFVWTNVSYSASWQLDYAQGSQLNLRSGNSTYFFKLVYADTASNHWEHAYGVPDLYIYQIQVSDTWLQYGALPN
jgi:hypothetical protein